MEPITVRTLFSRLGPIPPAAKVYMYCDQTGVRVQAEWNSDHYYLPMYPDGRAVLMEMRIPMTGGGPAT